MAYYVFIMIQMIYWTNWAGPCHWNMVQSGGPTCIWKQSWNACNYIMASLSPSKHVKKQWESASRILQNTSVRVTKCQRGQIIHSKVAIALNWTCLKYWEQASHHQFFIQVMRWMIKIGQIDINTKVSPLSSHSAMPRQEHWNAAIHIIGYLKFRHKSR